MTDYIIVGGGIIGMLVAKKLLEHGFFVSLFEANTCGKESSWAAAGIISPLYPWRYSKRINDLSINSQTLYKNLCIELESETNVNIEYINSGLMMFDNYDNKQAKIWLDDYNPSHKNIDNNLFFKDIMQLRSPRLLRALKIRILQLGLKLQENNQVSELIIENNKVVGIIANNKKFYANNVIICNGAWAAKLGIFNINNIFPIKGQMLLLQAKIGLLKHIILAEDKYLVPRVDGKILVGSTYENVGFNKEIDKGSADLLFNFAIKYIPELKNSQIIKQWSGLRPASSGDIQIGKYFKYDNLWTSVGHFSNGINTAPASAEELTNLMLG